MNGTQQGPQSPEVPADPGISLRGALEDDRPHLHGSFLVPATMVEHIARPLQRALVLVAQSPGAVGVVSPFEDQVLTIDDDELTHAGVVGYFDIDVAATMGSLPEPPFCFCVSIGPYVSEVIALGDGAAELVTPPPAPAPTG